MSDTVEPLQEGNIAHFHDDIPHDDAQTADFIGGAVSAVHAARRM